jgi:esterase/lipase superfamily enzyme
VNSSMLEDAKTYAPGAFAIGGCFVLPNPTGLRNLRSLDIRLAVGGEDHFLESNHRISEALWDKGVLAGSGSVAGRGPQGALLGDMAARHL